MIISINEIEGGGKTCLAVATAMAIQRYYSRKYGYVMPIYSNIHLNPKLVQRYKYWNKISELLAFRKAVIIWDEMWQDMDSRSAMKDQNQRLSNTTNQIRKQDVVLIYTLQEFGQIDLRVRNNTNFKYIPTMDKESSEINYEVWKRTRMGFIFEGDNKIVGRPFFPCYNHKEVVKPVVWDIDV